MAMISLALDGEIRVMSPMTMDDRCLNVWIQSWCDSGRSNLYMKDAVSLHGSPSELRAFAELILASLPPVVEPQPVVELIAAAPEPIEQAIAEVVE